MNTNTALENIYRNLNILLDEYGDFPETKESENKFWEFTTKNLLQGTEPDIDFENALYDVAYQNQRQGFIYGFKYAVSLLLT